MNNENKNNAWYKRYALACVPSMKTVTTVATHTAALAVGAAGCYFYMK